MEVITDLGSVPLMILAAVIVIALVLCLGDE